MKIRHYVLILLTLLTIAFAQPLVLFLGGLTLVGGVMALIYSDLPPEKQDAWEKGLTELIPRLLAGLKRQPKPNRNKRVRKNAATSEPTSLGNKSQSELLVPTLQEHVIDEWAVTEIIESTHQAGHPDPRRR